MSFKRRKENMENNRINKPTTKLIKSTLALILSIFIAHNLSSEAFATNYSVTYHDNFVSNMPVDESSATLSPSATLPATTPTRDGFQFNGWCTTLTADGDTCSGTSYAAGGTYTINQVASNNLTLYAMWKVAAPGLCTDTATCMQTATTCDTTLTDARDGKTYTVKTIINQCWMTQNLRITGTISADLSNFSGSDFNVSQYSLDSSDSSYSGHCDETNSYNYACAKDSGRTDYGVWYNYYAASAGTIKTDNNSTEAASDICPSGWRLPTNSEFSGITSSSSAFSPVYGGVYANGTLNNASIVGAWWSSTAYYWATNRYILLYYDGDLDTYDDSRYLGYYVRCVRSS